MELEILKYCFIEPRRVSLNGKDIITTGAQGSAEKSLVQAYRDLCMNYLKFFKMDNLSKLAILGAELVLMETDQNGEKDMSDFAVVLTNA